MTSFIVYQLSDTSTVVNISIQSRMKAKGYHTTWVANSKTYRLPDNSMWKIDSTTLQSAIDDISICLTEHNAINGTAVKLTRCIAVPVNPWAGITGE